MNKIESGYIHVYTGDGKGKSTAALGLAIRAFGAGKKVGIVYFDKGGQNYNERKILDKLGIEYHVTGLDRINFETKEFRFGVLPEDKKEAERGLEITEELFKKDFDLIILDELNLATSLGMLDILKVLLIIDSKPEKTELVITGRNAAKEILDRADLVTEMKLVKHYFDKGIEAREGIEY